MEISLLDLQFLQQEFLVFLEDLLVLEYLDLPADQEMLHLQETRFQQQEFLVK